MRNDPPVIEKLTSFEVHGRAVPALIVRSEGSAPGPVVIVLHGLGASKEGQRTELQLLARCGFSVIGLDAPEHGARRGERFSKMARARGAEAYRLFLELVLEAAGEVPVILDALEAQGFGPFALLGISMGAYAALAAASADSRVRATVSLLGSPDWTPARGSVDDELRALLEKAPIHAPERFAERPLLLATAGRDTNVPPEGARRFARMLAPLYRQHPEALVSLHYPDSGHFLRGEDWGDLTAHVLAFLGAYLTPASGAVTARKSG